MAETTENIYGIDFDSSKFIQGVEEALAVVKKFEGQGERFEKALKLLSDRANSVSFSKPIAEISNLKKNIDQFISSGGKLDLSKFNNSIDEFMKDAPALKTFLKQLNDELAEMGDTEGANELKRQIETVEQAIKVLEGQANTLNVSLSEMFDNLGNSIRNVRFSDTIREEFDKIMTSGKTDIETLKDVIKSLEDEFQRMDVDSEQFRDLTQYIDQAKTQLTELEKASQNTDKGGFVPLRKRLKELKVGMQELEEQGLETSSSYKQMQIEAAKLTDQLGDQSEAIRVLASDTYAFDAVVDGLQNVTAGFQVFEGVMALAGAQNEDLQKSMQKLMALMNIANGLQQINNFVTGQSAAKLALNTFWTNAQTVSMRLMAMVTGKATFAMRGLTSAVAATGIGALVVVVGLLVDAMLDWIDNTEEAEAAQKALNDELERQNTLLELDQSALKRSTAERIAYLKSIGATDQQIREAEQQGRKNELQLLEKDLDDKNKLYDKSLKQGEISAEDLEKLGKERIKLEDEIKNKRSEITVEELNGIADSNKKADELAKKRKDDAKKNAEELIKLREQYAKKLKEVELQAADIKDEQSPKSEALIRARYARELEVEKDENAKTFAKLGKAKVDELNKQAAALSKLRADVEVNGFKEEQKAAQKELLAELKSQQNEIVNGRIALIDDEYERVKAETIQKEQERRDEIVNQYNETTDTIAKNLKEGLITKEQADQASAVAAKVMGDSFDLVADESRKKLLENNKNFLQGLLDQANEYARLQDDQAERTTSELILKQSEQLARGEITYSQYQDRVTEIQKDANRIRLEEDIKQGEKQLEALRKQLAAETDERKRNAILSQIAVTETAINTAKSTLNTIGKELEGIDSLLGKIFGTDDKQDIDKFKAAANKAIQETTNLLKANSAAEVEAANQAVEAQRKRVDAATKLAEEGNAEYLKQEEDRLREVELKREQAARKQLQLDAALQASQILVAVAAASADSFKKGTGTAGVAAGIAAIIGAIAAGAALVKSLQNNQPKLFEGTDYVSRGNNPVGRDTIPAMLHEGEAVISARENRRYAPTIKAIRRNLLPEDVLNGFVRDYTKGIRYDRIGEAVATKQDVSQFSEMNDRLARLESVMSLTAQAIQGLGVNVRMDSDGFAASINTHLSKKNKILRS